MTTDLDESGDGIPPFEQYVKGRQRCPMAHPCVDVRLCSCGVDNRPALNALEVAAAARLTGQECRDIGYVGRIEAERDALQAAVDKAYSAMHGSAYVGGPTEREAWQTALAALGPLVTQHQGQAAP